MALVILSLVSVFAVPASAAYSYPMSCSIYYKDENGKQVATTKTFSVNAADSASQTTGYSSPTVSGYELKYPGTDSYVTYSMMEKYFPASNYVRNGSATYTVVYVPTYTHTIYYIYGASMRTAATAKTYTSRAGVSHTIYSPSVTGYHPTVDSVTSVMKSQNYSEQVYYYENTYTISYNANGGSGAPSSQTKYYFSPLTLTTVSPYRSGYSFLGWSTSSTAKSATYSAGGSFSTNANTTLYAVWQKNLATYTISYNANGGSGAPTSQTKTEGLTLYLSSSTPTRSGYTFKGWSTSSTASSATYSAGGSYTANASATLYAVWQKNLSTYTISYNANGGSGAPSSQTKTEGVTLTLSSTKPTRSGYTFLGWSTSSYASSASYSAGGSYTANAGATLYAVWSCNHSSCSTTYITGCDWEKTCNNCGAVISTGTTHGPYTYSEWSYYSASQHKRTKSCDYGDYSTTEYAAHSTTTVYEEYSASQHKVYSYCSTCNHSVGSISYASHSFTTSTSGGVITKTCSVCGYVETSKQTYTVSYNANGGSGAPSSQTKTHGTTLTLSSVKPTRSGYSFLGWSTSSTASSAAYSAGSSFTTNANTTLYAVWSCNHSATSRTYTTGCDWKDVCTTCGATIKTGTTHGPYSYSEWKYYTTSQHSRTKSCDHGDYSTTEYAYHTSKTVFEPYSSTQHKTYSYCEDCKSVIGSVKYEDHDFETTVGTGKTTYKCSLCGYSYDVVHTYTVSYDANGGSGAPTNQTKTYGITLTLSSTKPTRTGYTFKGWATTSGASTASYQPGGSYTANAGVILYAVWQIDTYTVSYDANGGSGAPVSQTKTYGRDLTLSSTVPARDKYKFLGWSTSSTATTATYYAGGLYTANAATKLYAVWQEINYDFSVSNLVITPGSVYQYENVSVNFKMDSWDKYNPYSDIPVTVYLNGTQVYSSKVNFAAYGVNYVTFNLNVGALEGTQTIEARVNWSDYTNETRTTNNKTTATFEVKKLIEVSADKVAPGGDYIEGNEVVSSFYVQNDSSSPVLPSDHMSFDFEVFEVNGSRETSILKKTWNDVVIPANGKNLVYFKWTVPEESAGKMYLCRGTANPGNIGNEQNTSNNATFFTVTAKSSEVSTTPNTRYERQAPSSYVPGVSSPITSTGSVSWTRWEYESDTFVLKTYGLKVSDATPSVQPDASCKTASLVGGKWKMRSGYGYSVKWDVGLDSMSGCLLPDTDAYTAPQMAYATFPEFGYSVSGGSYSTLEKSSIECDLDGDGKTTEDDAVYLLYHSFFPEDYPLPAGINADIDGNGVINSSDCTKLKTIIDSGEGSFVFAHNKDADGNARIHYIPIYVANGNYTVSVTATQIWTPAGMITATRNANTIVIDGTVYDDWYQS